MTDGVALYSFVAELFEVVVKLIVTRTLISAWLVAHVVNIAGTFDIVVIFQHSAKKWWAVISLSISSPVFVAGCAMLALAVPIKLVHNCEVSFCNLWVVEEQGLGPTGGAIKTPQCWWSLGPHLVQDPNHWVGMIFYSNQHFCIKIHLRKNLKVSTKGGILHKWEWI